MQHNAQECNKMRYVRNYTDLRKKLHLSRGGPKTSTPRASRASTPWQTPRGGGSDADAGWVTGDGPAMYRFDYFDDFVVYYRIYSPTDAMWRAWNAAQSFDVDEFEEVAPDENNDDVD